MKKPAHIRRAAMTGRRLAGHFFETFLSKNIVLVQAIAICPIIAVGTELKLGVVLMLCTAAVLLPTSLCMSLIGEKLPSWLRPPVYTVGASLLLLGAAAIVDHMSPKIYADLYLFLPLMAVNTIFTYRAGGFSVSNRPAAALVDAVGSSCGFGLVICAVSCIREIAIYGTVWGHPLEFDLRLPEAALPYAAFIMLGFMAALLQWIKSIAARVAAKKEAAL